MKKNAKPKKLTLGTQTIKTLSNGSLTNVVGGTWQSEQRPCTGHYTGCCPF